MDAVWRAGAIYVFLLIVFRLAGTRTLAEITTFDFVLLLVISEAIQNALVGTDYSLVRAFLVVLTLVALDIALSLVKQRSRRIERWIDDLPLLVFENGRPVAQAMEQARIDEEDILAAARQHHGLERMDQIQHAVLERTGGLSIIPKRPKAT